MGKSKLLNKILGKTIPFLLASTMIYTLYVGKVEGYLQRGFGFFPDKFDKKTNEKKKKKKYFFLKKKKKKKKKNLNLIFIY